jgi:hypothetical protein
MLHNISPLIVDHDITIFFEQNSKAERVDVFENVSISKFSPPSTALVNETSRTSSCVAV